MNERTSERIGNVRRRGGTWEFLINGRDRRSGAIVVALVVGVALAGVLGAAAVVASGAANMAVWAVLVLVGTLGGVFWVVRTLRGGYFARYLFRIDLERGTVAALDRREHRVLWSDAWEPGRLYLARARVQVGYASHEVAALVYGHPRQDHVEDDGPLPHKTVLTVGARPTIEALHRRMLEPS